ncbi:MAG: hypothetical protein Q7S21_05825 [archaeon]|nr:hypothetical protein [archaeon]
MNPKIKRRILHPIKRVKAIRRRKRIENNLLNSVGEMDRRKKMLVEAMRISKESTDVKEVEQAIDSIKLGISMFGITLRKSKAFKISNNELEKLANVNFNKMGDFDLAEKIMKADQIIRIVSASDGFMAYQLEAKYTTKLLLEYYKKLLRALSIKLTSLRSFEN